MVLGSRSGGSGQITTGQTQPTIAQTGARGVINWSSFSVEAGNKVQFNNGAGATLNMVPGEASSTIAGSIGATGSVYLVNPQGVIVAPGGKVITGGGFVASTRPADANAFMANGSVNLSGSGAGDVVNPGGIRSGSDTVLVGRNVSNAGTISAGGAAILAAADDVVLQTAGDTFRVTIKGGSGNVRNTGGIQAVEVALKAAAGGRRQPGLAGVQLGGGDLPGKRDRPERERGFQLCSGHGRQHGRSVDHQSESAVLLGRRCFQDHGARPFSSIWAPGPAPIMARAYSLTGSNWLRNYRGCAMLSMPKQRGPAFDSAFRYILSELFDYDWHSWNPRHSRGR